MIDSQQGLGEEIQNQTQESDEQIIENDNSQNEVEDNNVDNADVVEEFDDVEQKEGKGNDKVKKIKRVVRTLDKRNRMLEAQLAQQQQILNTVMQGMQQQQQQQQVPDYYAGMQNNQQFDPYQQQQQPDMYEIARKVAEEQLAKREQEKKNSDFVAAEESLRAKYEDYDDFTSDVRPFLTKEMILALRELSSTSLEALYKAWGSNSAEVKRISKLPAFQQYLAVAKLDEKYSSKSNHPQINQSVSSKKVIPPLNVKPSANIQKEGYAELLRKMK